MTLASSWKMFCAGGLWVQFFKTEKSIETFDDFRKLLTRLYVKFTFETSEFTVPTQTDWFSVHSYISNSWVWKMSASTMKNFRQSMHSLCHGPHQLYPLWKLKDLRTLNPPESRQKWSRHQQGMYSEMTGWKLANQFPLSHASHFLPISWKSQPDIAVID